VRAMSKSEDDKCSPAYPHDPPHRKRRRLCDPRKEKHRSERSLFWNSIFPPVRKP
jgi:hypothetical protein